MSRNNSRPKHSMIGASLACAAALGLVATPALARGPGWGGGWGHRDHDIDAGDIVTGVLILGGLAAIIGAVSSADKAAGTHSAPPPRSREPAYGGSSDNRPEWHPGIGIDSAVNRCTDEVNHGRSPVDRVDTVNRDGNGWRIAGRVAGGAGFSCSVDSDGRIRMVSVDGRAI